MGKAVTYDDLLACERRSVAFEEATYVLEKALEKIARAHRGRADRNGPTKGLVRYMSHAQTTEVALAAVKLARKMTDARTGEPK